MKLFTIFAFFVLLLFTSCQDEEIATNDPETQETIVPSSELANMMTYAAANYGAADNILDNSSCISVNLPVTIVANGITITIETLEDLALIEDVFEEFETDEDILEFIFPITIILNDYTEIVIESIDELEVFIEECTEEPETIECIDFQYPISFSVFNTEFDIVDTIVIENDEALYEFLNGLENDGDVILASLNYPVTLVYSNGETVEVNSNQELSETLNAAEAACEDDDENCDLGLDGLEEILVSCEQEAKILSLNYEIIDVYSANFNAGGEVIVNGEPTVTEVGQWDILESDNGLELIIEGLQTFELLNGSWELLECDGDYLKFTNGETILKLHCEDDQEESCSAQEVAMYLQECHWVLGTNLLDNDDSDYFYFNPNGELLISNPYTDFEITGYWEVILTDNGVKLTLEIGEPYNIISSQTWELFECDEDRIKFIFEDDYIVFEQVCEEESECNPDEVSNYLLECVWNIVNYNGSEQYIAYDIDFNENNYGVITYGGSSYEFVWTPSTSNEGGMILTLDVIPIGVVIDEVINGNWSVVECDADRLELVNTYTSDVMVLEQDCEVETYDCEDLQANIGDECEDTQGNLGYINENWRM